VLFLCTGNSARSIMGEALLRHHAGDRFEAHSAGVEPKGVNPLTLRVLSEKGIDTSGLASKSSGEYMGKVAIAHAIIVCENARQQCPRIYPFAISTQYWPIDDPAAASGTEEQKILAFRAVRDEIGDRIVRWLANLRSTLARPREHIERMPSLPQTTGEDNLSTEMPIGALNSRGLPSQ
jgi:arsenate reductase